VESLAQILSEHLADARRVAVLGVGSPLHGDDAAGLLAAQRLQERLKTRPAAATVQVEVFLGESAPENLTGAIRRFAPTHLVILDAADLGKAPGTIRIIDPQAPTANASMSTHSLPLGVLAGYLERSVGCRSVIVGVQPANGRYGAAVSELVDQAATKLAQALLEAIA